MRVFITLCMCVSLQLNAQVVYKQIVARNTGVKVLADGRQIRIFGFAATLGQQPEVPGPTLIFNEGDSVNIELFNLSQGAPHTIHLHGLDVDQANDGVPHLSFEVGHMDRGNYKFVAPHAGTYLYHCHVVSTIHVQAGMYGLLIVKPKDGGNTAWTNGPAYEQEFSFLMSEIDTSWHTDDVLLHEFNDTATLQIPVPKFAPQYFLVNGQSTITNEQKIIITDWNSVYFRFANIGFYGVRIIFPEMLNPNIISSDGRPLPNAEISDTLIVYPGERYGVLNFEYQLGGDSIQIEYFNMNTMQVEGRHKIPLVVYVGIEPLKLGKMSPTLFPNPATGLFEVDYSSDSDPIVEIEILNGQGQLVSTHSISMPQSSITYSTPISSGIYWVSMRTKSGKVYCQKLMVR